MKVGNAFEESNVYQSDFYGMGTVINNLVFGRHAQEALKSVEKEVSRLERMLSLFIVGSDISRINNSAGKGYVKVNRETYQVLSSAVEFSGYCHGCFDVTLGPLTNLWRNSGLHCSPPEIFEISQLLPLTDYTDLALDTRTRAVCLKRTGQSIDLGGIGKGFAADLILEVFKKFGITSAYTNFGGNVAVMGVKPDGTRWHIGIRHPRKADGLIGVVSVDNKSVVTSGDYQRYFIDNKGKRYHHILDPSTGYPADSDLTSVTVIADSSVTADALSTIIFISGLNKAAGLLKLFPGIEAVLVDANLKVLVTGGLKSCFEASEGINIEYIAI